MPGLAPGIHVLAASAPRKTWMAGTGPAMTGSGWDAGVLRGTRHLMNLPRLRRDKERYRFTASFASAHDFFGSADGPDRPRVGRAFRAAAGKAAARSGRILRGLGRLPASHRAGDHAPPEPAKPYTPETPG